ncbi:hypothetical protein [Streptomyces sp. MZ04]|uniref:hypothetical protein n=1 Tax=Streptomyces sp. MZ04 TaxID=2559236 RepID=UPI0014328D4D|nr:hypothetical protein [Streptomyces sp. MZ04]
MNAPKYAQTKIRGLCWDEKPGDVLHCTLGQDHKDDHYHAYTKTRWPNLARRAQPQG